MSNIQRCQCTINKESLEFEDADNACMLPVILREASLRSRCALLRSEPKPFPSHVIFTKSIDIWGGGGLVNGAFCIIHTFLFLKLKIKPH